MSRPSYYVSNGQHVFYYHKGKMISGTETLTDIGGFGWGFPQAGRNNGEMEVLPDSVSVYYCGLNNKNEMYIYQGGISLPFKQIENLFKQGYVDKNEKKKFNYITTGMAPGGRITVWVDHIEIKRGKVEEKQKYINYPIIFSSTKALDSIETNNYIKSHPVNYSIWDKPDPRYELDFGFCSENGESDLIGGEIVSKEGIRNTFDQYYTDATKWNIPCNKKADYKGRFYQQKGELYNPHKIQLPVSISLGWRNNNKHYYTRIVLPKEFPERFTMSYVNPKTGKKANYNRLVFGIEKDGEHCIIWLDGPNKQEKLMRFKGQAYIEDGDLTLYAKEVTHY
jgi:hypothetical protein